MAGYAIANINVKDPTTYKEYTSQVQATLDKYGGKFVVRGGKYEIMEGDWQPGRLVIIEFESPEAAKNWYNSPEYAVILPIRQKASTGDLLIVEGYQP